MRNRVRRKTKVSSIYVNQNRVSRDLRCSREGEADGKRVNIPVPVISCDVVTESA